MSHSRKPNKSKERERTEMDFKIVGVPIETEEGDMKIVFVPDPRYWEVKTLDGKRGYYNVLTKVFLPAEEVLKKFKKLVGKQVKVTFFAKEKSLGTCTASGIRKLIGEQKHWEALFSLHTMIHYQLQMLLLQSFKRRNQGKNIADDHLYNTRWKLLQQRLRYFRETVDICFIAQAIDDGLRDKLIKFNQTRDKIAHKLIQEPITAKDLKKACSMGLKLLEKLESNWGKIIIGQGTSGEKE